MRAPLCLCAMALAASIACDEATIQTEVTAVPDAALKETAKQPAPVALTPAKDLAQVLPRLPRDGSLAWRQRNERIPGHFAARLYMTQPERSALIITVDDLHQRPDRIAWFHALPTHIGKYKGRSVSPEWIHALVAGRYEVMVRADHAEFRSQGKLAHWFDRLRTSRLVELTAKDK